MHNHRWGIVQGLSIFDKLHDKQPKFIRFTVWAVVREMQINKQLVITITKILNSIKNC